MYIYDRTKLNETEHIPELELKDDPAETGRGFDVRPCLSLRRDVLSLSLSLSLSDKGRWR